MTDVIFTIHPQPALIIWSTRTLVQLKGPSRLMASAFCHEA